MKKRICMTVMAFVMVLSLAACAEKDVQTSTNEEVVASTSVEEKTSVEASAEQTSEASVEEVPEASVEEASQDETTVPEKNFAVGIVDNNVYENTYAGVGCSLPEDWIILDQEQMLAYNQLTAESVGDDYAQLVDSLQTAYDMIAINSTNMDTITILFEKLDGLKFLLTEDTYLDATLSQSVTLEALTNMGMEGIEMAKDTISFAGKERQCIKIKGNVAGVMDFYEVLIPVKLSKHFYCMTIASYGEDRSQSTADLFYAIEE